MCRCELMYTQIIVCMPCSCCHNVSGLDLVVLDVPDESSSSLLRLRLLFWSFAPLSLPAAHREGLGVCTYMHHQAVHDVTHVRCIQNAGNHSRTRKLKLYAGRQQ